MKLFGDVLTQLRSERGLSQRELAGLLGMHGVQVSNQAVSKWENGSTQPNATQFLALLRIFNVQDALATFTDTPASRPIDRLNRRGQDKVADYIHDLLASGLYSAEAEQQPLRYLPLYDIAASAGTGQYLDESAFEQIPVGPEVPADADFGIRLAGDSMQPRYQDGEIVWVHRQATLEPGQIGIFLYDGCSYCKRLEQSTKGLRLCSLNPAYAPIELRPEASLTIFGRVVS